MSGTKESPISLADFIDSKCRDCHGRGLVQRRIEVKRGEWRSAKLMCSCIDRAVERDAKNGGVMFDKKSLLSRILEALKHREAQKEN